MAELATLKHADRLELLKDAAYFATELVARMEALVRIEQSGPKTTNWQQSAAIVRKVRGLARVEADKQRQRAKLRDA